MPHGDDSMLADYDAMLSDDVKLGNIGTLGNDAKLCNDGSLGDVGTLCFDNPMQSEWQVVGRVVNSCYTMRGHLYVHDSHADIS